MATCRKGHQSAEDAYCDVCGARIAPAVAPSPAPPAAATVSAADPARPAAAEWECPDCHRSQDGRYCEVDGYDSLTRSPVAPGSTPVSPAPPQAGAWLAMAVADRDYYDSVQAVGGPAAAAIPFPAFCPERRFRLHGEQVLIGRRSGSRGIQPDIDLTGPPEDPAVGHAHAMLIQQPDDSWAIVDLRSVNGTYLNGSADPIEPEAPVPVADGDRIHLGAWTTLILRTGSPRGGRRPWS
jgi:hypothetical protein